MVTFICMYSELLCTLHFLYSYLVQLELDCVCRALDHYTLSHNTHTTPMTLLL